MGRKNRRIRGRDTRPLPRDGATLYGLEETEGPRGRTGIFTWYDASGQRGQ